jgi:hypothetical protein
MPRGITHRMKYDSPNSKHSRLRQAAAWAY